MEKCERRGRASEGIWNETGDEAGKHGPEAGLGELECRPRRLKCAGSESENGRSSAQ